MPCLIKWPGHIAPGTELNGIQSHEDLVVTLAAAAGMPNLKTELLTGKKMGDMTYKVLNLEGYNQLDYWTGKTDKSARREFFYYDETDLMAIRVDGWKMHICVKPEGSWWDEKYYPNVPYLFNLLMDPMEKMDPQSKEWGYIGRKFFAQKMWAPNAAAPIHRGSSEECGGISTAPEGRHAQSEEDARRDHGEDGKSQGWQQLGLGGWPA